MVNARSCHSGQVSEGEEGDLFEQNLDEMFFCDIAHVVCPVKWKLETVFFVASILNLTDRPILNQVFEDTIFPVAHGSNA